MMQFLRLCFIATLAFPLAAQDAAGPNLRPVLDESELNTFLKMIPADREIISGFSTRVRGGKQIFRIATKQNIQQQPWVALYNLTQQQFEQRSREYADAGWTKAISQSYTLNRRRLHLAVWVGRDPDGKLVLPAAPVPENGTIGRELSPLNDFFKNLVREHNLPGVTVAVSLHGQMIYNRAFGYADVDRLLTMQPETEMRIASLSKPMTAAAVQNLCYRGRLNLNQKLLPLLQQHREQFRVASAAQTDARWQDITVRHLLQHTAGFDRDRSGDTMFAAVRIRRELKLDQHPEIADVIRFQLRQPLDFTPGTEFHYSNVGYSLLGRVIESVSGKSYSDFMQEQVLDQIGMKQTRLGRTRFADRGPQEAVYVTQTRSKSPLIFDHGEVDDDGRSELVETPWGQWDIELMDAHGGWVSTAADLVRFASALDAAATPLSDENSRQQRKMRPQLQDTETEPVWYGLGWSIRELPDAQGFNYWHTGLLSGTSTLLVRRWDGCCWAVLCNCDRNPDNRTVASLVDGPMHRIVNESLDLLPQNR